MYALLFSFFNNLSNKLIFGIFKFIQNFEQFPSIPFYVRIHQYTLTFILWWDERLVSCLKDRMTRDIFFLPFISAGHHGRRQLRGYFHQWRIFSDNICLLHSRQLLDPTEIMPSIARKSKLSGQLGHPYRGHPITICDIARTPYQGITYELSNFNI